MTALPPFSLLYLNTWLAGQSPPVVSTLDDLQKQVVANAAIVPAGVAPKRPCHRHVRFRPTNLVIDINGYFGQ